MKNQFKLEDLPQVLNVTNDGENKSTVVEKKVIRLTSIDGKFPCPHVKYIGQIIRVDLSTMATYDITNPLNGITERRATIDLVNESGAKTGAWTLIEAIAG